jgi:hypothetical protein
VTCRHFHLPDTSAPTRAIHLEYTEFLWSLLLYNTTTDADFSPTGAHCHPCSNTSRSAALPTSRTTASSASVSYATIAARVNYLRWSTFGTLLRAVAVVLLHGPITSRRRPLIGSERRRLVKSLLKLRAFYRRFVCVFADLSASSSQRCAGASFSAVV